MNAFAAFVVLAALLLAQDYFAPSSARMVALRWMGDMDGFDAAYRRRFPKRALALLLGSAVVAVSVALDWPDGVQAALLVLTLALHMTLVLFDITKSRRFL